MAWYYAKSGGTAADSDAGRYTTEKANNSWATEFATVADYYDSIETILEVGDVGGTRFDPATDVIYVSSASTFSVTAVTLTIGGTVPDTPVLAYSVDDSAVQDYLAGASETATSGDYSLTTVGLSIALYGIDITVGDDILPGTTCSFHYSDCSLNLSGSGDALRSIADASSHNLKDTIITSETGTNTGLFLPAGNGQISMLGGSTVATSGSLNDLVQPVGNTGAGFNASFVGVDLSNHGSGTWLLGLWGNDKTQNDAGSMRVDKCKLNASVGWVEEIFAGANMYFLATNSSAVSAAAEYQFYQRTWAGDAEDEDSSGIVRTESTAFEGGEQVSIKVTTVASCSAARPLVFDLPARFAALSVASTDTIRIYFAVANTVTLNNVNCYADLVYPDGTTKELFNKATNQAGFLTAGTTHTDDSGSSTWENGGVDLASHNEYRMDIDTSGDVGADCVPVIRIYVEEPSVTIYFDTTVDVVA